MMRRTIGALFVAMWLIAAPVSADHGPSFDVTCAMDAAQVVLDPGHGGPDPGAVHDAYGLHESSLNLEIAQQVSDILRDDYGYTVALTREDNETELGNSERGAIANACAATVFVEIHLNAAEDRSVDYAQTFWGEKEKDLAFSQVMNRALGSLDIPVNAVDRFDNGGLLRAKMPSILVEAVFLSNVDEAQALAEGTRQKEIARAIGDGIASWLALGNG
ncbi:MAG: N-acetylmuramoyl-L-alanine amidase [Chloroflexota bacterium]|nr:N-acetylmuramoyl-L-alanine amidase [Chloroflexota bacterium]